jgi:hypothetical protein
VRPGRRRAAGGALPAGPAIKVARRQSQLFVRAKISCIRRQASRGGEQTHQDDPRTRQ